MNNVQHSIVLEPLAMEEVRTVVDHMIKTKKQSNNKRFILSTDTSENDNSIIHTVIEASVVNLQKDSSDPVRIYETTYIVDKTTGDIVQNEKCIQELTPECDNSSVYVYC